MHTRTILPQEMQKVQFLKQLFTDYDRCLPMVRPILVKQGWGDLLFGQSIAGLPLCLHGHRYAEGFGTHGPSEIKIVSKTPLTHFSAAVGVDDNTLTRGEHIEMVFSIHVAGRQVWSSQPLRVTDSPVRVDLDLPGVTEFTLHAGDAQGRIHAAHADWIDPCVTGHDGQVYRLGTPNEKGIIPGHPLSFSYNGVASDTLFDHWPCVIEKNGQLSTITWTDSSTGLQCRVELIAYEDFPAVEWVVRFKNTGSINTPILSDIQPLDLKWTKVTECPTIHHSKGSNSLIDDFQYQRVKLAWPQEKVFASEFGRGSSGCLPFFNLEFQNEGWLTAVGWSGQWATRYNWTNPQMRIVAGMEKTHLKLHPGEEIRTPRILMLYWQGTPLRGNNLLRQLILKHHTPRSEGKTVPMPVTAPHWGGMKSSEHLRRIDLMVKEKLDYDYYWIDAGWYGPPESYSPSEFEGQWAETVGDWNHNITPHPDGLKPISDACRRAGMKFLLWFEPERAIHGTPITKEHPEWFLGERTEKNSLLLNLGLPDARKWVTELISSKIDEYGIDCYRQDFNIMPLSLWRENDAPDRQGITEAKHIEGLYLFWDELLRRHPGLLIDNCASGGRRIDLETIRRSIPLWRSDFQCHTGCSPTGAQVETMGLLPWVPLSTAGAQVHPNDTYAIRSAMCTGLAFHMFMYEHTPIDPNYPFQWHRERITELRRVFPYFLGDYYPLIENSISDDAWQAYQLHRPDLDEGILVFLRRDVSPFSHGRFPLSGLTENKHYIFEDADTPKTFTAEAAELMSAGIAIEINQPHQSRILFYRNLL